ncbi:MAG: quercetin 2,3-dioxygenase [Gammaproteobacteria bacterium SG8_11]|nr:MAG: quercetin 2,3-dioxygenase [Gammaproteobacteria bacterium SG8_11]
MIAIRQAKARGYAHHGWLTSWHSFSFANYYDPEFMGISALRVINEDHVAPGAGFPTHGHRDMEIISYVVQGALEHKDSMGNGSVIRPGEIQRMSAGTGVTHSEYNASKTEPLRFLQIWIQPDQRGVAPGYEQKRIDDIDTDSQVLKLIASPDARRDSLRIHQNALVYAAMLSESDKVHYDMQHPNGYVHVVKGGLDLNGMQLNPGDGAFLFNESGLDFTGREEAEFLLFDLP